MSVSIQEILTSKLGEVEALRKVAERYPDASFVRGRLYDVPEFVHGDKANNVVIDEGQVYPVLRVEAPDGAVFIREMSTAGLKLEHFVSRVFKQNPEAAIKAATL